MTMLVLPTQIHADGLLPFLDMLCKVGESKEVQLNFARLRRVSPAGLVALAASVTGWLRQQRKVSFSGLDECSITGYLQRMDLFRTCGIDLAEKFRRYDSHGRFVPVQLVGHGVEEMRHDLAICLAPGGDDYDNPNASLYDLAWYVFTEIANNVRQHSRGLGYAAAQVMRSEGLVKIALADNGKGIRKSFVDAGFPWAPALSDCQALLKALEPRISSKGRPTNEGVGLTLVAGLVRQTRGWLLVVSGNGVLTIKSGGEPQVQGMKEGGCFPGTLLAAAFRQQDAQDFSRLLHNAKIRAGLLPQSGASGTFKA